MPLFEASPAASEGVDAGAEGEGTAFAGKALATFGFESFFGLDVLPAFVDEAFLLGLAGIAAAAAVLSSVGVGVGAARTAGPPPAAAAIDPDLFLECAERRATGAAMGDAAGQRQESHHCPVLI